MKSFKVKYLMFGINHSGFFRAENEDSLEKRLNREYSMWTVLSIEEI